MIIISLNDQQLLGCVVQSYCTELASYLGHEGAWVPGYEASTDGGGSMGELGGARAPLFFMTTLSCPLLEASSALV